MAERLGLTIREVAGSSPVRCALTHYCIVRQDLPLGDLAAQLIHAAGESAGGDLPTNTYAVALAARNESHLEFIEVKLRRLSIPHVAIREPDPPYNGAITAIGLKPVADRKIVKRVTKGLRLIE